MHNQIEKCRICDNHNLEQILHLGDQALTGVFPKTLQQHVPRGPLELVKCVGGCGLVQLRHSFPPDQMYGDNYGYRSGLNASMVRHLHNLVQATRQRVSLKRGDIVLDIGSNDSTTLQAYGNSGLRLLGVDPSGNKFKQHYPIWIDMIPDFFSAGIFRRQFGDERAQIITSIAMFYDLEDPMSFMGEVHACLADDGIWIFEQSYLPMMMERNAYDTICHEHCSYYALRQIQWMAERVGFKILDVELNDSNGGSFCVTAAKTSSSHVANDARLQEILAQEEHKGYNGLDVYEKFRKRVFRHRDEFRHLLRRLVSDGKQVYGYGASTKGNVILQFCDVTREQILGIAEVNQDKFGAFTPHTRIPIASEADIKAASPDYLVVFPWHFRENILEREQSYLNAGGQLIFPLPELEIVNGRKARRVAA